MPSEQRRRGEPFFLYAGLALAAVVVLGFGLNAIVQAQPLPPITPLVIVHGLFMIGWYVMFVVQAQLIGRGGLALHMRLGQASLAVVAGVLLTGVMVGIGSYQRKAIDGVHPEAALIVLFNLINLTSFAVLFVLGWLRRRRPAAHKRFMLLAGVAIVLPAAARLVVSLGDPEGFATVPLALAFLIALAMHDRASTGAVLSATKVGSAVVVAGMAVAIAFGQSPAWARFVHSLLG